ncbi:MAG: hypothetical protein CL992_03890 [Euryarchaeota archaeon]|nr:hypothetical protein [Euryarchaeota archaeon]
MTELGERALSHRVAVENLGVITALMTVLVGGWMAWPILNSDGNISLSHLIPSILLLVWAVLLQDLIDWNPTTRARIGGTLAMIWPGLLAASLWNITSAPSWAFLGSLVTLGLSGFSYTTSRRILAGRAEVVRYRGVMILVGTGLGGSFVLALEPPLPLMWFMILSLAFTASLGIKDWMGDSEMRRLRREYNQAIDRMEDELLILKSRGEPVDQAHSLFMRGKIEGHKDPEHGLKLLVVAQEELDRAMNFNEDLEIIREASLHIVNDVEELNPSLKRPRKSFELGDRERGFGTLREAEVLYRRAKSIAEELLEWWPKAELAIMNASSAIGSTLGQEAERLRDDLTEAKRMMEAEKPKEAWNLSHAIPEQIESLQQRGDEADEALSQARAAIEAWPSPLSEGWQELLTKAEGSLAADDPSTAKGFADRIMRDIEAEKDAKQRLDQRLGDRSSIEKRWAELADAKEWSKRWDAIKQQSVDGHVIQADHELSTFLQELDVSTSRRQETKDVLDFLQQEWSRLRRSLESAGIRAEDADRDAAEADLAAAISAFESGDIDATVDSMAKMESHIERAERRI